MLGKFWIFLTIVVRFFNLYSEDGAEFKTHKELFGQTDFMREILNSAKDHCCGTMEIICPCSKEDLGDIVHFLYNGQVSYKDQNEFIKIVKNLVKINDNLFKIFGFPKNLNLHHQQKVAQNCDKPSGIYIDLQFTDGGEIIKDSIHFENISVETKEKRRNFISNNQC